MLPTPEAQHAIRVDRWVGEPINVSDTQQDAWNACPKRQIVLVSVTGYATCFTQTAFVLFT